MNHHDPLDTASDATDAPDTGGPALTRRATLFGGAGLSALGLLGAGTAAEAAPLRLRVAVLVAADLGAQGSGKRFLRGLKLGAERSGQRMEVRSVEVAVGEDAALAAAKQALERRTDVVVAALASPALPGVADLCRTKKVALVVANTGAHVGVSPLDGALVNSLQLWQSSFAAGRWAGKRMGRSMFSITAAPDAGFDPVYAFYRGFTGVGGREVGRALTHQATRGVDAAARAARDSGAAVVKVNAFGRRATEIVEACRRAGVQAAIVVDPLTFEPKAGRRGVMAASRVWTASSWLPVGQNSHARAVARIWKKRFGGRADAFALLGHDTAFLIAEGARRARRRGRALHTLPMLLKGARVPGARGMQVVEPHTRVVSTPLSVRRSRRRDLAGSRAELKLARVPGDAPAMMAVGRAGSSAYVNEYSTT